MVRGGYSRFVALGDSQTEGLWDGDDADGVVGFADRLAAILASHNPDLLYANLAIRGKRIRDVIEMQLPQALSMQPDLLTVCIGMNDATRPGRAFDRALADLDAMYGHMADSGAMVVTTTFPDIKQILPVGRLLAARIIQINDVIRTAAHRHGFGLVDLYDAPSMRQPQTWSHDRMHASSTGHMLFAEAAAEALELPGSSHDWAQARDEDTHTTCWQRQGAQVRWIQNLLLPWLWRHMRGKSGGDGRDPKRPALAPVHLDTAAGSSTPIESEFDGQRHSAPSERYP
ncbi:MAG: SGNH/GDSL hydrolase family protein [Mycobacterium sp.]